MRRLAPSSLFCLCACLLARAIPSSDVVGARLLDSGRAPLHTQGRFIVDRKGERVKLACVNYYGAETKAMVAGGLHVRTPEEIATRIVELGFNCVRFPYSIEAHLTNPVVKDEFIAANQRLQGKRFMDVLNATIGSLTDAGLMVILDNHISEAGWCCSMGQQEGLWYVPNYPEQKWIESLTGMAAFFRANARVVGIGLRNEVHDVGSVKLTWGDGNLQTDWAAAATRAGDAVLQVNPNLLVMVMALCSGMCLNPVRDNPIVLTVPQRVVYEVHNYLPYVFTNAIPHDVIAWSSIHLVLRSIAVGLSLALAVLWMQWRNHGQPPVPSAPLLRCFGGWLVALGLLAALVALVLYIASSHFCYWWAYNVMLPRALWPLALSALGIALLIYLRSCGASSVVPAEDTSSLVTDGSDVPESGYVGYATDSDCSARSSSAGISSVVQTGGLLDGPSPRARLKGFDASFWTSGSGSAGCRLNLLLAGLLLLPALFLADRAVQHFASYGWVREFLDDKWGFVLEEGRSYTAPVFLGEFGYANQGVYWKQFVHYLSDRDVDFAYWAVNGQKYGEGFIDEKTGYFWYYEGCATERLPMIGTDCHTSLGGGAGTWAGDGTCVYNVPTNGSSCHDFCVSRGRACMKAQKNAGTCGLSPLDPALGEPEEHGCLEAHQEQICVCSKRLWVWDEESFGLLNADFQSVKAAWRLRDLQGLAQSPAAWYPRDVGCLQDVKGFTCVGKGGQPEWSEG